MMSTSDFLKHLDQSACEALDEQVHVTFYFHDYEVVSHQVANNRYVHLASYICCFITTHILSLWEGNVFSHMCVFVCLEGEGFPCDGNCSNLFTCGSSDLFKLVHLGTSLLFLTCWQAGG